MTILVTGATGTIGTQLIKELQQANANFAVMSSKPSSLANARLGDFNNTASLIEAFKEVDTLFVLLPLVANKLELAANVASAAKAAGVKHIVRSSGAGADSSSHFALPRLQGSVDDILRATGITCTFIQPAGFMQNYATFLADQVRNGTIYAAHGDAKKSMVDARDIAAVAAKILLSPQGHAGKIYTLTSNDSQTESESAEIISKEIGKPVKYQAISQEDAIAGMKQWGMPEFMIDIMGSLFQIVAAGYASGTSNDVKSILDREPISFVEFVKDYKATWA